MRNSELSQKVWQDANYFLAFGFGSGLIPFAPGTWGTLFAIPLYLLLAPLPVEGYLTLTLLAFIYGVWISHKVCGALGIPDYKGVVWDEVVGYLLTMTLAPEGWFWILIGFVLFRIFDIWKPYPIRWVDQHTTGGFGVMLDDVLAAVPAWLILQGLAWGIGA